MEDVVHLLLFNLTFHFSKRYYNLTNVLFPYARDNWPALQLPPKVKSAIIMVFHNLNNIFDDLNLNSRKFQLKNMQSSDVKDEITKALKTFTDRFKAGDEIKNKIINWALVSRSPPKAPNIVLPEGPLLTEKYINDLFYEQARINYMPQNL